MRWTHTSALMLTCLGLGLGAQPAAAGKFPGYLKSCKEATPFLREEAVYAVPAVGGGAGIVKVVSQIYQCRDKENPSFTPWVALQGMTDASGKELIPFRYERVLPYSTTGALVGEHGPNPRVRNVNYHTYTVGKGEGKERFDFQEVAVSQPANACAAPEANAGGVSAVIGEWFGDVGQGKSHVTLFTPEGKPRKLEYMGGDGIPKPAVQRIGDVLLARWRDEQGVRSGILDLQGRQVAPVLGNAAVWLTPLRGPKGEELPSCLGRSVDLFIEGPSLDPDPARPFIGPLLTLVGRDGQPAVLPKGAIGLFPVSPKPVDSRDVYRSNSLWAVVFPTPEGFEFTVHLGAPSEALLAAETAPRYRLLGRHTAHGGLVAALGVTDGRWRVFRANADLVLGENTDLTAAFNGVIAQLDAEVDKQHAANAARWALYEEQRLAQKKLTWKMARENGRLCEYRVDRSHSSAEVEEYIRTCGPGRYAGLEQLAREKGVSADIIKSAADAQLKREQEWAAAQARRDEEMARYAREHPGASYIPGQWDSAIKAYGNDLTDSIKKSGENWLEQRQKQYNADWQRSQRAY